MVCLGKELLLPWALLSVTCNCPKIIKSKGWLGVEMADKAETPISILEVVWPYAYSSKLEHYQELGWGKVQTGTCGHLVRASFLSSHGWTFHAWAILFCFREKSNWPMTPAPTPWNIHLMFTNAFDLTGANQGKIGLVPGSMCWLLIQKS